MEFFNYFGLHVQVSTRYVTRVIEQIVGNPRKIQYNSEKKLTLWDLEKYESDHCLPEVSFFLNKKQNWSSL